LKDTQAKGTTTESVKPSRKKQKLNQNGAYMHIIMHLASELLLADISHWKYLSVIQADRGMFEVITDVAVGHNVWCGRDD
jgi:hypothetical protein